MNEPRSSFPPPHDPSPGPEVVKEIPRPGKEGGSTSIYVTDYRRIDTPIERTPANGRQVKDLAPLFIILAAVVVLFPLWMRENPAHGPNDGSRWNTIFYLFEYRTMEWKPDWESLEWQGNMGKPLEFYGDNPPENLIQIGDKYYDTGRFYHIAPFWSIDMIEVDGKYYSSKPPLLSIMVYGVTWTISQISALFQESPWTFQTRDGAVYLMRTTVIVVQIVPFLFCIWLLALEFRRMTDRFFVQNFCIACAALGTYLTPWLIPLNNHLPAACSVTIAAYAGIRIWYEKKLNPIWFLAGGTFGALAFCCELPALAFLVGIFIVMIIRSPLRTLVFATIPALILVGAFFYASYQVTGDLRPIPTQHWEEGGIYDYPGSYWNNPSGIDALDGEKSEKQTIYLMHMLIGHHGFFLLTPIFLVALLGIFANMIRRDGEARPLLAFGTLVLTAVVAGFYAWKTNNYGGGVQGFRWLFWIIPLWLLMLPAGVHVLGKMKVGRAVCYLLLAVSLFSVYWALPQVDDKVQRPFSNSWAHLMFRKDWMPDTLEIDY